MDLLCLDSRKLGGRGDSLGVEVAELADEVSQYLKARRECLRAAATE